MWPILPTNNFLAADNLKTMNPVFPHPSPPDAPLKIWTICKLQICYFSITYHWASTRGGVAGFKKAFQNVHGQYMCGSKVKCNLPSAATSHVQNWLTSCVYRMPSNNHKSYQTIFERGLEFSTRGQSTFNLRCFTNYDFVVVVWRLLKLTIVK